MYQSEGYNYIIIYLEFYPQREAPQFVQIKHPS